ncbi:hypothetical protein Cgig2_019573 [Carnegiea gigantea]|uniref:GDSL esterase/lipase EXL3 n=1 Tax=Carnegiea gigantea TaxID=171969 RepID=A0A9Q1KG18_9CARY|nr:hypothetical protein Cgig2_019573 [Carnegiea gigantea]
MRKLDGMKTMQGNVLLYQSKCISIMRAVWCTVVAFSYLHVCESAIKLPKDVKVPAILVFGDSVVDPGNNNYLKTIGKANFPPYGRDFEGGVPTGRYSNGKIPSDLLAEEIGIKELVPPYLDPSLQMSDLVTGVSFASGTSGYDPLSSELYNALSLADQLKLFKEYINKLKATVGENRTSEIVSQSVYLVCAGSNDITNTYFVLPIRRWTYNVPAYTDMMVNWASTFIQELYTLGARRIGVINAPPCGCLPSQRTLSGGLFRGCADELNQAAILFNGKLYTELRSLNQTLPGSRLVYHDIYNPLMSLIMNPFQYGFAVTEKGCCGTGNIEVSFLCTRFNPGTCSDASKYVFWDSFHPTEATYRMLVHQLVRKSVNGFF